ncbi:unnamed protein product [Tenebrio molitor]|nr:unnamed protein product [Tenebrio molitor]
MKASCSVSAKMSDSEENLPSDIELAAQSAIDTLIPAKSKERYEIVYKYFEEWMEIKKIREVSEKVVLAYFAEQSEKLKPSSLWCRYSMLRMMVSIKIKIGISQYHQVVAFLKRKSEGYRPKKSCIFCKEEIHQFLKEMNDKDFLFMKVVLIFRIFGACRREEITNLMRRDVQDKGEFIWITLPNTKTKITREFAITDGNIQGISCLDLFRKYMDLRPSQTKHDRFFLTYRGGKCTQQSVGVNTIGGIPKKIATALGLSEPANYTGHCFRRY